MAVAPRALYLAVVQFVFVSTWTIYVVFLPELLLAAGVEKVWLPRLLLADQLLMVVFDFTFGVAAARGLHHFGRIAPAVLTASLLSCLAFMLLPHLATSPVALLGLTAVWVVTSSALRAPLYALLARHAAAPEKASLAAMMTLGMAVAGMVAPWLGTQLKAVSPVLPFAVSSIALALLVLPLAAAERAAGLKAAVEAEKPPAPPLPAIGFFVLLLTAALGFQTYFNLAAAPAYLRHFASGDLIWLMPMFWVGVAGGCALATTVAKGRDPFRGFAIGMALAVCAAAAFGLAGDAFVLPVAQLAGGVGWGLALCMAFAIAERYAPAAGASIHVGALFSMLALAAVARIGLSLAGMTPTASQWPLPLWLLAAVGMGIALLRSGARQTRQLG